MNGGQGIELGGRKSSELIPQEDCLLANSMAFPGEAKKNCFLIIHSLFLSSLTLTFLPQIHREFLKVLDVIISPWEMWKGEQMSMFSNVFLYSEFKNMKFNPMFLS